MTKHHHYLILLRFVNNRLTWNAIVRCSIRRLRWLWISEFVYFHCIESWFFDWKYFNPLHYLRKEFDIYLLQRYFLLYFVNLFFHQINFRPGAWLKRRFVVSSLFMALNFSIVIYVRCLDIDVCKREEK